MQFHVFLHNQDAEMNKTISIQDLRRGKVRTSFCSGPSTLFFLPKRTDGSSAEFRFLGEADAGSISLQ